MAGIGQSGDPKIVDRDGNPKNTPITPDDLLRHVPGWRELLSRAAEVRRQHLHEVVDPIALLTRRFDGDLPLKDQFRKLVGWKADHPDPWVRSPWAYDAGYRALVRVLLGH